MSTWLDDISSALANLGGIAHYESLYPEVKKVRSGTFPDSWKKIIQRTIQDHSADSDGFKGNNIFYSVKGIGSGVWGLRSHLISTPSASDIEPPSAPERLLIETYRVLRDTELARKIKALHKNICQLCGQTVMLKDGATYAEAHHIKPLGSPHNGPDVAENIVVLCPNHHVMLDYGTIPLEGKDLRSSQGHVIGGAYIAYHNENIFSQGRL
ncbi:HNH endonuclease [Azospira restricta]|uniref:HNH endonuclease n=1 Tax=Azospira restricta TaxID=404405 RepID=A0A974SNE5_9RHOO|nr:HNH endonuclease [Azospira restricta]QRJ62738.1 HNH endonuclease [Azospira restricta]